MCACKQSTVCVFVRLFSDLSHTHAGTHFHLRVSSVSLLDANSQLLFTVPTTEVSADVQPARPHLLGRECVGRDRRKVSQNRRCGIAHCTILACIPPGERKRHSA